MIFERQLAPGQWIDELALAREWQISRTPLREALKVLAAEGLVLPVPRQGCKVAEMSEDEADELLPIMALLEGRCAYEAVRKAGEADIPTIVAITQAAFREYEGLLDPPSSVRDETPERVRAKLAEGVSLLACLGGQAAAPTLPARLPPPPSRRCCRKAKASWHNSAGGCKPRQERPSK